MRTPKQVSGTMFWGQSSEVLIINNKGWLPHKCSLEYSRICYLAVHTHRDTHLYTLVSRICQCLNGRIFSNFVIWKEQHTQNTSESLNKLFFSVCVSACVWLGQRPVILLAIARDEVGCDAFFASLFTPQWPALLRQGDEHVLSVFTPFLRHVGSVEVF